MADNDDGGKTDGDDGDKGHPESVSWTQFVGERVKAQKAEAKLKEQVSGLEDRIKDAPSAEAHKNLQGELDDVKAKHQTVSDELKANKEKSASGLRESLKTRGLSDEEVKDLTETEMTNLLKVLERTKTKPDLGSGGGVGALTGSPMQLAQRAYADKH